MESDIEEYVRLITNPNFSISYRHLFEPNKDRIYITLPKTKKIETFVGYFIKSFLKHNGYSEIDYYNNRAVKDGRTFRIGKILKKMNELKYLHLFESDPERNLIGTELNTFVISRNIDDVINMSTNRVWTSCMDLSKEPDKKNENILEYLTIGGVVVYGINNLDTDIKNPFFRRWYSNDFNNSTWFGNIDFSSMKFIEEFISKACNKPSATEGTYFGYDFMNGHESYPEQVSLELNLFWEVLENSYEIIELGVQEKYSGEIRKDFLGTFDISEFEDRIEKIKEIVYKYSCFNEEPYDKKHIDQVIRMKIDYEFIGMNVMEMSKLNSNSNIPLWCEPENLRYKKDKDEN